MGGRRTRVARGAGWVAGETLDLVPRTGRWSALGDGLGVTRVGIEQSVEGKLQGEGRG